MQVGAGEDRDQDLAVESEDLEAVARDLEALIDHARRLTPAQLKTLLCVIRRAVSDQAAEP